MAKIILFNKPWGVLSQFTDKEGRPTLAQYIRLPGFYPAGRLDHDSEGLLLLTDDGQVQHHIAHPANKLEKTYWVQVEGAPTSYALSKLSQGVELNDGMTLPARVRLIPAPRLWEREVPVRERKTIPTQWLEISITEGRNRQVRRMTAAVGHPTLRLVRVRIGNWTLEDIAPGKYQIETLSLPKSASTVRRPGTSARRGTGAAKPPARGTKAGQPGGGKKPPQATTGGRAAVSKPAAKTVIIQKPKTRLPPQEKS